MKKLITPTLSLLALSLLGANTKPARAFDNQRMNEVLAQSAFNQNSVVDVEKAFQKMGYAKASYHPVLWTVAISNETKAYPISKTWVPVDLAPSSDPAVAKNEYYAGSYRIYVKPSFKRSSKVFVVFGGSFSGFAGNGVGGGWFNKTFWALEKLHDDPTLIAIPGYLDKNVMAMALPRHPDLTGRFVGKDLYTRLAKWWASSPLMKSAKTGGFVSFSGPGNVALAMLELDEKQERRIFNRGGIAFSPILEVSAVCRAVDSWADAGVKAGMEPTQTMVSTQMATSYAVKYLAGNATSLLEVQRTEPEAARYIVNAFGLHLINGSVKNVALSTQATGFNWTLQANELSQSQRLETNSGNRLSHYFLEYSRNRLIREKMIEASSDGESDLIKLLRGLKTRVVVVHALDDANHATGAFDTNQGTYEPDAAFIKAVGELKALPNVTSFTPKYGTHMAYALETEWFVEVLRTYFE